MKNFLSTSLGVIMFLAMCLTGAEAEDFTTQVVWSGSMLAIAGGCVFIINRIEDKEEEENV